MIDKCLLPLSQSPRWNLLAVRSSPRKNASYKRTGKPRKKRKEKKRKEMMEKKRKARHGARWLRIRERSFFRGSLWKSVSPPSVLISWSILLHPCFRYFLSPHQEREAEVREFLRVASVGIDEYILLLSFITFLFSFFFSVRRRLNF